MDNHKRKFSKEYKLQVIRMVKDEGKKVYELGEDIGVKGGLIYKWIRDYEKHPEEFLPGDGKPTEKDELRRLKKKIAAISEENEILKKAMAIFSKQQKPNSR